MTRSWTCPVCDHPGDACACGVDRRDGFCGGRWVVRGTRVWLRSLRSLRKHARAAFPHLKPEQLRRALDWLDHLAGAQALIEEELDDLAHDIASSESFGRGRALCRGAPNGRELMETWLNKTVAAAWEAERG